MVHIGDSGDEATASVVSRVKTFDEKAAAGQTALLACTCERDELEKNKRTTWLESKQTANDRTRKA